MQLVKILLAGLVFLAGIYLFHYGLDGAVNSVEWNCSQFGSRNSCSAANGNGRAMLLIFASIAGGFLAIVGTALLSKTTRSIKLRQTSKTSQTNSAGLS